MDTTVSNNSSSKDEFNIINSNGDVHSDSDVTPHTAVVSPCNNINAHLTRTVRQSSIKLRSERKCILDNNANKENWHRRHSSRENRRIQENKLNELLKENWNLKNELLELKRMFGVSEDPDVISDGRDVSKYYPNLWHVWNAPSVKLEWGEYNILTIYSVNTDIVRWSNNF